MDGAYMKKSNGQQDSDPGAHARYCASSGIEPLVIVGLEGLQKGVAGWGEEYGVVWWGDGEREMDGCGGVVGAVYKQGLETGQGRETHRHVWAGHPVVLDSLKPKDRSSCPSLLTTHVCRIHNPICRRGPPPVRPGDGPVCPSPLARSSDRPREHPHSHDHAGQSQ